MPEEITEVKTEYRLESLYHADENGVYSSETREKVRYEGGVARLPFKAFLVKSTFEAGKIPVMTNGVWELVEDNRGKKQYSTADGSESVIDYVGEVKDGFTLEVRPSEFHRFASSSERWIVDTSKKDEVILKVRAKLNRERDAKCQEAIIFDGYSFLVDKAESLPRLTSLFINAILAMQTQTPFEIEWRCDKVEKVNDVRIDNYYKFDIAKALELKQNIEVRETTIIMTFGATKDNLKNLSTADLIVML